MANGMMDCMCQVSWVVDGDWGDLDRAGKMGREVGVYRYGDKGSRTANEHATRFQEKPTAIQVTACLYQLKDRSSRFHQ